MKKSPAGPGAVLFAFLVLAFAARPAAVGDAAAGKVVYAKKCGICHGADGEGSTGYAKALGLQPARLSSDKVQKMTDAQIKKVVLEGFNKMKPVKGLSEVDVANVIAYVRTFNKK